MSASFIVMVCVVVVFGATLVLGAAPSDARFERVYDLDHPADFKPNFPDRAAWEKRAEFLRHQMLVAHGLWPMPEKTPLNAVIHGKIDRDAYTIEKVYFQSMPGHYVCGNLYRPKGKSGKLPAVLSPYGHWPNGRFIWKDDNGVKKDMDSGAERDPIAARSPLQANCAMLARMGCVVFIYDMVGYCDSERLPIKHREGFTDAEATLRLQSFMGLQTWNSIRSLDFVLSLPEVDPSRVAVAGSSSGGTQTIALCAADPRPTASFPMVMVGMNMQGGCVCENAPLYRVGTNNVELACLFAPKPEGAAAANDWTRDFMTRGLPEMKSIWKLYDAEDRVTGGHVDFGHNHNVHSREMQYAFLNRKLKLGWSEPVREGKFEPVDPKELSVWDDAHPVPADALDAAGLRNAMTRRSDVQLAKLADQPQEYVQVLRPALQAMIADTLPTMEQIQTVLPAPGVRPGFISRRGSGERVPCAMIIPKNATGLMVVWAHPDGCASLTSDAPGIKELLAAGRTVVAIDPFMSESFGPTTKPALATGQSKKNANPRYVGGFTLGYNRSVLAEGVHDLLTVIALTANVSETKVDVIGIGEAGPAALLASALANDKVGAAAIDVNQFDFDKITNDDDPMLLPGGLKYGGICGFLPLRTNGRTMVANARTVPPARVVNDHVRVGMEAQDAAALAKWVLQPEAGR